VHHDNHQRTPRSSRRRLRPTAILLGLLVCLLLLPAATANADVMAKYRTKYNNKLTYYRNQMDFESDSFYTATKQATESHSANIAAALADPEQEEYVPLLQQAALSDRSLLQATVAAYRTKMYANIAAFKATGVKWFKTKADKTRFKARLTTMRGGFVQIFAADEDLMQALYLLGTNADIGGAANHIMSGDMTRTTAEDLFAKGLRQLRALR
jgi:hypothetical protein